MAPTLPLKQWVLSHIIIACILFLTLVQLFAVTGRDLKLSVLDIGQGDAIFIQTPEFKNILIDAGPDSKTVDELGEQLGFFDKTIDLFIITHPDRDHYAGIMDVMQKYRIKGVLITGIANQDRLYESFLRTLKQQKIPIYFAKNNQDIRIGRNAYLDVLYPFKGQSLIGRVVMNKNATSIVIRFLVAKKSNQMRSLVMLTGDAEISQEREILLNGQDIQAEILKLGHHGAKTSTSDVFLNGVNPKTALVSVGKDNQFGHPHPEVMGKMKDLDVLQTLGDGAIEFNF